MRWNILLSFIDIGCDYSRGSVSLTLPAASENRPPLKSLVLEDDGDKRLKNGSCTFLQNAVRRSAALRRLVKEKPLNRQ